MDDQSTMQPVQETQHGEKSSKVAWILVVLLFLTNVTGFGLYGYTQRQLDSAQAAKVSAEKKTAQTQALLDAANTKITRAAILPKSTEMSPQCNAANNDNTRLAPVNMTPIDGYSVYIVNCVNELVAGRTNTGKVVAFTVNADGSQKFAYGAGAGEPYCISAKIINATAAQKISTQTGLPICKTF